MNSFTNNLFNVVILEIEPPIIIVLLQEFINNVVDKPGFSKLKMVSVAGQEGDTTSVIQCLQAEFVLKGK